MLKNEKSRTHILVVDDDESIRNMVYRVFNQAGHKCFIASSGIEAMEILNRELIEVIISDIVMTGMSGIELTQEIKQKFSADIILMTGYGEGYSFEDAITKGASDFILKPFSPEELLLPEFCTNLINFRARNFLHAIF